LFFFKNEYQKAANIYKTTRKTIIKQGDHEERGKSPPGHDYKKNYIEKTLIWQP